MNSAELIIDAKAGLGEGSIWHSRQNLLYWIDIMVGKLHAYDPVTKKNETFEVGQYIGTVVPSRTDAMFMALHHGFARMDFPSKKVTMIADPESDHPNIRFNDGKCDPAGRFWAGTMELKAEPKAAKLYCLDADLNVRKMLDDVTISNGIVWSMDHKTMYYIDTVTKRVDAFDYDLSEGTIHNRRTAVTIPDGQGFPDGMTIDAEGMLWIAHWGGGCVTCCNPRDGKLLQTIRVPASQVTSCAFGGPDLNHLYITSARDSLTEAQLANEPHAGGLFCVEVDTKGIKAYEFAG
ncbi:MAG: SMP-30/gluconolactonase/LRE family protein [Chthoniobacterales bacterium]